jgi:hypothetical protein
MTDAERSWEITIEGGGRWVRRAYSGRAGFRSVYASLREVAIDFYAYLEEDNPTPWIDDQADERETIKRAFEEENHLALAEYHRNQVRLLSYNAKLHSEWAEKHERTARTSAALGDIVKSIDSDQHGAS